MSYNTITQNQTKCNRQSPFPRTLPAKLICVQRILLSFLIGSQAILLHYTITFQR